MFAWLGFGTIISGFQDRLPTARKNSPGNGVANSKVPRPTILSMKNSANDPYKIAAEQMKNMKPEDMDRMIKEMDSMNPIQAGALKAMGMDPEMMKKTMKMMKENPQMISSAQKLMSNMTPEQLMEQSRIAQERMAGMTTDELETMNKAMTEIPAADLDKAVDVLSQQQDQPKATTATTASVQSAATLSSDPSAIDAMFRVGELLSDPPIGACSFAGFAAVPVIQLLRGDREMDLSESELKECWADGSLGATRVDRAGFERVWKEVQDYFEDDILGEARKEAKKLVSKKSSSQKAPSSSQRATAPPKSTVGANLSSDQLSAVNERVKNLSSDDMDAMLGMMETMDPIQEARMKAMGVDPAMMQKTAKMMKDNPMMREAAKKMLSNMSPEEMLKQSQKAQQEISSMSKEEIERTLSEAELAAKANPNLKELDL